MASIAKLKGWVSQVLNPAQALGGRVVRAVWRWLALSSRHDERSEAIKSATCERTDRFHVRSSSLGGKIVATLAAMTDIVFALLRRDRCDGYEPR